ncbi:MAG: lipopolysaccharide biosynthesis protein [bacterium]
MINEFKRNTITSINWSFLKVLTVNITQFLVGIVLARLIAPEKFGIIGLTMIFISFADVLSSFGISEAIVQKNKIKDTDIETGFTLSVIFGIILYLISYIFAPFIALFFNEPIITSLIRFLGLAFPIRGITAVCLALLMRKFDFKSVFYVELISYIFGYSLITVVLAFLGFGVWALAIGSIFQSILKTIMLLYITRSNFKIGFNFKSAKHLLFFGSGVSGTSIFNNISDKIDYLIVGKFMSAYHVGLYTKAFNLMRIPLIAFSHVLGNVLLTSYSSVQDNKCLLKRSYYKSIDILSLLSFPIITGMAISAHYIIVGLYGEAWSGAVQPFRILCFAVFFKVTLHSSGSLVKSQGYVHAEAVRQLFYALFIGLGVLVGAQYNLTSVSLAIVIGSLIFSFTMFKLCLKILDGKWIDLFNASKGGIFLSIPVAITNIIIIYIFNFYNLNSDFIGLIIIIMISVMALCLGIIYIPQKYKGAGFSWILSLYAKYLPKKINDFLSKKV